ncbi:MAG: alanine--tRNA ligase [Defluviitaleaceae bacterium]|nr:alanine--tRNA ligase [Defluviitaleaceae bacterium]
MQKLGVNEVRERYLAYFEGLEHKRMPSFSLVPDGDKSLLLINAGMAPLKPYFMGEKVPPAPRATTCQKCIRTGDIENVGKTARHGTFFEMLGNFSFANYFKREAIHFAWEFVTEKLEIPKDKLYVTVFTTDNEAHDIWHNEMKVPRERIYRFGKEENFWELSVGPCGPCSEIYFDRGPEFGQDDFEASVLAGEDRYLEFWNLVFIQNERVDETTYIDLANKGIDTGMGLERMAMIMQGENSIFDVDTIRAIRDEVCKIAGVQYESKFGDGNDVKKDISIRLITDHIRSVVFMISDGILPGAEGREYVLKRLLRRAARHGKLLGIKNLFLTKLAQVVIDNSKQAYPVLAEKADFILRIINTDEARFYETLDSGMSMLNARIADLGGGKVLSGADAFKLHDTYGFPFELTQEILEEKGLSVDEKGFEQEMQAQKQRARDARIDAGYTGGEASILDSLSLPDVDFVGYAQTEVDDAKILHITEPNDDGNVFIILDKTPVYAEAGGQKADYAALTTDSGTAEIIGCAKAGDGQFAHIAKILKGNIEIGQTAKIALDKARRDDITRHHTATHLLHAALGKVLGSHVEQAGASKSPDGLRFDFTHFAPMTKDEINAVEDYVNSAIFRNLPVVINEMTMDDAKKAGAVALFGEKYGDTVRVVDIGGEWVELCGGTHLAAAGAIGAFKIISESGIAASTRRIEAVAGKYALAHFRQTEEKLTEISQILKTPQANLKARVEQMIADNKDLQKQVDAAAQKAAASATGDILNQGETIGNITAFVAILENTDMDALRNLSDDLIGKMSGASVLLLAATKDGKGNILARATKEATASGVHCGNIVKAAATAAGGGGGGRPDMAQAGIKDISKMQAAMDEAKASINK